MSSFWSSRGTPTSRGKGSIEEIDLTLSSSPSPEPQVRSRPAPRQQLGLMRFGHSQPQRLKKEKMSASNSSQSHPPAHVAINPGHLERIVNTSDTEAIKTVLLNLCKVSPALSGAVARGLAPHSTFAQSLIKRHDRITSRPPQVKAEHGNMSSSQSESSVLLLSPKITSLLKQEQSSSPRLSDHSSGTAFSGPLRDTSSTPDFEPLSGTYPKTPVRNPGLGVASSGTLSKLSTSNVSPAVSSSSSRNLRAIDPIQSSFTTSAQGRTYYLCKKCGEQFPEGSTNSCFHHPGRKQRANNVAGINVTQYTCCGGDEYAPPCEVAIHEAQTTSAFDTLKRRRSSATGSYPTLSRNGKNPKLR